MTTLAAHIALIAAAVAVGVWADAPALGREKCHVPAQFKVERRTAKVIVVRATEDGHGIGFACYRPTGRLTELNYIPDDLQVAGSLLGFTWSEAPGGNVDYYAGADLIDVRRGRVVTLDIRHDGDQASDPLLGYRVLRLVVKRSGGAAWSIGRGVYACVKCFSARSRGMTPNHRRITLDLNAAVRPESLHRKRGGVAWRHGARTRFHNLK